MGIGAAIGGSIVGSLLGKSSSDKASKRSASASNYATDEQRRQYDLTRGDLMPYMDAGTNALGQYTNAINNQTPMYGAWENNSAVPQYQNNVSGPPQYQNNISPVNAFADRSRFNFNLEDDDIYKFQRNEALEAATRGANAGGMQLSGNLLQALQKTAAGEAGRYQNDAFNRQLAQSNTNYGRSVGEYGMDFARNRDMYDRQAQDYGLNAARNRELYGRQASDYGLTLQGNQAQYNRDLQDYNMGVSRNQDMYGRNQDYLNRLVNLAGSGQNAAAGLGGLGANMASNIGNIAMANAQTQGSLGMAGANTINNAIQSGVDAYTFNNALNKMYPSGGGGYSDWNDSSYMNVGSGLRF